MFEVKGNPQLDKDSFTFSKDSKYPYFTRTVFNNGILGYVDYLDDEHLVKGNSLAVGMMGMRFFYMKHDFYAGQFTKTAFPLFDGFNESVALWFISWLNKSSTKYLGLLVRDFENAFNNTELIVPYKDGQVAVDYIESRIRELEASRICELEASRIRELEAYLLAAGFEDCVLTQSENRCLQQLQQHKITLKSFKIGEIFNDSTGRDIIIRDTKDGNIPLISHQHDDNGISKYIAPISGRRIFNYKDTLSLADRGVFLATTQDRNFHIGTRVKALTFKDGEKSESIRLFFVAAINKLQVLFSEYLTNATDSLPSLNIFLPVTADGTIDFAFMNTYISAIKKQCIAALKQEISREHQAYEQVLEIQPTTNNVIDMHNLSSHYSEDDFDSLMAAEPFECYKWKGFDQGICDFFGSDKTILIGCYKGKKYKDWIRTHNIYTIRLGDTKGSMEANRELFDNTSLFVLYELGKPNKLSAYKIIGNKEMGKEELLAMDYPNKKPRKSYMTFCITPIEMDLSFLVEHHLIERLIELNSENAKGTPVFIQP